MALRKARAAVASTVEVEAAAEELLGKGNAVDAVVAGVFAACATTAGALLGPVQILVAGAGAGFLAIDGRVRQPGIGAPRPRGFTTTDEIPEAARIGVPWLPAALSVAVATMGSATFGQVLGPALALAKGSPRHEVLSRIAARGPRAVEERPLGSELLAVAGRPSGGLLTSDDLSSPRPEVQKASRIDIGSGRELITLPWTRIQDRRPAAPMHDIEIARVRAVMAVDRNATFAFACWDDPADGLLLPDVGLRAPYCAEPVRRGQTRIRPGEVRAAAAPVAFLGADAPDVALTAFGASDAYDVLAQAIAEMIASETFSARGEARLVALAHAKGTASVLRG